MTDILPETQSNSGPILRAAREEMSLTIDQVANELHLRPVVVKALEDENYDEFSSDVFLRGYFRTYCRLVNLHEARMMGLLDQQLTVRQKLVEHTKQQVIKEIQQKKRKKLFITLAVFFTCLLLVAFAYQMATTSNDISFEIQKTDLQQESNDQSKLNKNDAATHNFSSDEAITDEEPKEATDQNEIDDADAQVEEENSSDPVNSLIENSDNFKESSENVVKKKLNETAQVAAFDEPLDQEDIADLADIQDADDISENVPRVNIVASLKATFTGDCWFKVTDSNGKAVIAALKKADDEINFEGSAPFHIVIGDASKVTLVFQDDLVNLRPFTSRNGRAELTLKPSDSVNEG